MIRISIIATFINEEKAIGPFLDSVLKQTQKPDEIVLVDGESDDRTVDIIKSYMSKLPIKLIIKSGNRSVGRNTAAREAKNDIIACTDIGCILDKGWLKNIIQPFEENEKVMVVSGFFKAAPKTFFERVSSTFMLTDHDNINSDEWLPSSRSIAYKKEAWQKAGGYPENMNLNEDTPFALAFKKAGYKFYFAQNAIVYWRPRPNIKEFFKQYYSYAKGDGQGLIHWKNYLARTIKYLVGIVLIILGFWIYIFWILAILAFLYYITKRSIRVWRTIPGIKTFFLVTFLILIDDIAELFGFWIGLLKNKLKNRK